ncbi:MAG: C69 family dipeptidase [Muribaculaceae bacterium]|nr:C69 family dipeptidase [Muribaculaceae bacterium]
MKTNIITGLGLALTLGLCGTTDAAACTSLIAAPGATAPGDGTMITYAADSHTLYGELYRQPAADHPEGAMRPVVEWDTGKLLGSIPEVSHTYATIGNMNEHGLTIAESTWGGRPELEGSGLIDYGSLIYITLQRAKTAREALEIMTALVRDYGYASEGESFSIADPTEVWILELIGKGKTDPGAVWVARRVPEGHISGHANHARIHTFPQNDPETLYSPDVIDFARSQGYYEGPDADFDFSRAYAVTDAGALRGCDARVWSYFNRFAPEGSMDQYLPWIFEGKGEVLPLWVKPAKPLSSTDLKEMMRDHFEGTPLDMTKDIGAGPFDVPYRWRPMGFSVDSVEYTHERAIATQQTGFSFVSSMSDKRPEAMKGILWFGVDDANTCVYVPVFNSTDTIPPALDGKTADLLRLSWDSMFWVNNFVANQAYNRYSQMIPDIRRVQGALETAIVDDVNTAETALKGVPYPEAQARLRDMTLGWTDKATKEYKALGDFLFVKFMDGNIKKQNADGSFTRSETGMPVQPVFGGYNERYFRSIVEDAGDRLRVPEIKM